MNTLLAELADLLAGQGEEVERVGSGECEITGVEIDSRAPLVGKLFVALRGARFDGHDFVAAALAAGAAAALVERRWWASRQPAGVFLVVEDTRHARQPQQRHRPAAHLAGARSGPPCGGVRAGHQPARRDGDARRHRPP